MALPGIGRKTANVILGNAFDVPGITVDTHFGRLVRRWGWTEEEDPVKVEHAIGALVPKRDWTIVSHQVIFHGRRVCHARKPACGACTLSADCPSYGTGPTDPVQAAALVKGPSRPHLLAHGRARPTTRRRPRPAAEDRRRPVTAPVTGSGGGRAPLGDRRDGRWSCCSRRSPCSRCGRGTTPSAPAGSARHADTQHGRRSSDAELAAAACRRRAGALPRRRPARRRRARWPASPCPASARPARSTSARALAGRPALVNVWASWCAPCRDRAAGARRVRRPARRRAGARRRRARRPARRAGAARRARRARCRRSPTRTARCAPRWTCRPRCRCPTSCAPTARVARVDPPTPFRTADEVAAAVRAAVVTPRAAAAARPGARTGCARCSPAVRRRRRGRR